MYFSSRFCIFYHIYLHNNYYIILLIIGEIVQNTSKDTLSEESENDVETCMSNSCELSSVISPSKFPKTCMTDRQQKPINKRKVTHQNHANIDSDSDFDTISSSNKKKRRSSKFIFILYSFHKFIK